MAPQFYPKFFYFPRKKTPTTSPNDSTSMKNIKTLIQTHILPHVLNVIQTVSMAKSKVMDLVRWKKEDLDLKMMKKVSVVMMLKKSRKKSKFRSSFRMCCNWHSSHVLPIIPDDHHQGKMQDDFDHVTQMYYDSSWNSAICAEERRSDELSGYLQWLEEKETKDSCDQDPTMPQRYDHDVDEIDHLAEMFIAKCHEKFRLEKQESYRRYQEMLARSM